MGANAKREENGMNLVECGPNLGTHRKDPSRPRGPSRPEVGEHLLCTTTKLFYPYYNPHYTTSRGKICLKNHAPTIHLSLVVLANNQDYLASFQSVPYKEPHHQRQQHCIFIKLSPKVISDDGDIDFTEEEGNSTHSSYRNTQPSGNLKLKGLKGQDLVMMSPCECAARISF